MLSCSRRLKFPLPKWSFNRKLLWRPPTEKLVGVKGRTRTSTDQGGLLLPAAAVTLGGLWNLGWTCWELASFPFMSSISLFLCSFYLTILVPLPYIREEGALSTTEEEVVFDIARLSTHLTKWHSCLFTMSLPLRAENVELLNLRKNTAKCIEWGLYFLSLVQKMFIWQCNVTVVQQRWAEILYVANSFYVSSITILE